jgi:L-lysine exporter family protein LysE/ArgO
VPTVGAVTSYLAGLGLMLSLIVAIGAQNLFVLRQGLRREHVGLVVAICAASDAALTIAGVAGMGAVVSSHPTLVTIVRWAGAAFLVIYGLMAARRALRPGALDGVAATDGPGAATLAGVATVATTCLALTWLNPHVYLDTVFLVGTIGAQHASPVLFTVGAVTASIGWFTALGYGARALAPVLGTPRAWRILDGIIAVVMIVIAVTLVLGA